ncbi:MAG: hypothetical protein ACR2IJ_03535 [Fluviibacter sp.]
MSRLCRLKTDSHGEDGKWAYEEIVQLRARVTELEADAARFEYLQNIPVIEAQSFFWNYSSRKRRAKAIDDAMKGE